MQTQIAIPDFSGNPIDNLSSQAGQAFYMKEALKVRRLSYITTHKSPASQKTCGNGSWRFFKGGEQVDQYIGDWQPKEKPTIMDEVTKKEVVK